MPARMDEREAVELFRLLETKVKYEAEREALALRLKELDRKTREAQVEYGVARNRYTRLLTLPTEVTCLIFQTALEHSLRRSNEGEGRDLLEVVVSHVCHQWRTISLVYHPLWATFRYYGRGSSDLYLVLDRLDAYLERSASHTLELSFDFRDAEFTLDHFDLLEKILRHAARWRSLTILSDQNTLLGFIDFLPRIEAISAPNLEYLTLCCNIAVTGHKTVTSLQPTIFTNGAPKLRGVRWNCSSSACLPPLSNITTLHLEASKTTVFPFSWSAFLDILSLPYLATLSLAGDAFLFSTTMIPLIAMDNLKHLGFNNAGGMTLLLPHLRAPSLETLVIKDGYFRRELQMAADPYVFPSLRSVSLIRTEAVSPNAAAQFARITGSTTELLFLQQDIHNTFIRALDYLHSKDLWTKVKCVTCIFERDNDITSLSLLNFAKAKFLRISSNMDVYWSQAYPQDYETLKKNCTISMMDLGDRVLLMHWPPGEHSFGHVQDDADPFAIEF
ncbi:hypothetical protein GALMADRAFT_135408 [Galerina marginata CBS 339.88]|uniref:F-box domain-containing protein n=1 Tax=Galerina marginata (strain CBS 339.88) TaxID=685588 RepID=A0A067TFX3_GALM3|nr:hypothetical protein GALMADRAFT_135408 [Galerina marginata CBS 339.88]